MNPSVLILLSLGHVVTDISGGAVPALLPYFQRTFGLSYGSLGFLSATFQFTSSVTQPLFGLLSDRVPGHLLLPLACIVAGGGLALTGLAPGYGILLLLLAVTGVGVAAFHPLGYRLTNQHSGQKRGTATALFSVGGNFGVAIGPLLATGLVLKFGGSGTLGLAVPGLVIAGLVWWKLRGKPSTNLLRGSDQSLGPLRLRVVPIGLLTLVVILRSAASVSLNTFIPLYYIDVIGVSERTASEMLSLLLVSGAFGTLIGGPLSDRIGRLRVLVITLILVIPALQIFLLTEGALAKVALSLAGFFLVSSFAVTVVMAQELWPENVGVASGVMVGLAFGIGGLIAPLIGLLAERWGLFAALQMIVVFPVSAVVIAGLLAASMLGIRRPEARTSGGNDSTVSSL